jgi:acetamidase/formamidase
LGFHQDLDEAAAIAAVEMVKLMTELYSLSSKDALSLASLVVHLRVTQMVNGVRGVHAVLPHGALKSPGPGHLQKQAHDRQPA